VADVGGAHRNRRDFLATVSGAEKDVQHHAQAAVLSQHFSWCE